jgi:DNA-binding CsgD family transcriptional regulator
MVDDARTISFSSPSERDHVAEGLGHALRMAHGLGSPRLHDLVVWMARRAGIDPERLPVSGDDLALVGLTPREHEVLGRIIAGRSNKEIGVDLGISEKTAEVHVSNVMHKLGVTNRVEAATQGIRLGAVVDLTPSALRREPPAA